MKAKIMLPILLPLLAISLSAAAQTTTGTNHLLLQFPPFDNLSYMVVLAPVVVTFVGLFLRKAATKEYKQPPGQHQHI